LRVSNELVQLYQRSLGQRDLEIGELHERLDKKHLVNNENQLLEEVKNLDELVADKNSELAKKHAKIVKLQRKLTEWEQEWDEEVEELTQENKDLKADLTAEQVKNQELTAENEKLKVLVEDLEEDLQFNRKKKSRLLKKLHDIREQQELDAKNAQQKNVCRALIKWEGIPKIEKEIYNSNNLKRAITETNTSFINIIAETQNHLGVSDLTQITTTHKMPDGKNLRDLIEFYQNNNCQEPCCLGDYQRLQNELVNKEKTLLQQFNNSLHLGLKNEELTVHKLVSLIEELLRVPVNVKHELATLRADINGKVASFNKDLALVKKVEIENLERLFSSLMNDHIKQQILVATDYQGVSTARQEFLTNNLEKLTTQTPSVSSPSSGSTEKWWITFLIISLFINLVGMGWLLTSRLNCKKKKPKIAVKP
jgi:hypothetical protein